MKPIELLVPARDFESGIEAVNCGADAVYIGAEEFGARKGAGNSVADIAKLALYAHKYGAKVYIPLNTILNDEELLRAHKLARSLWEAGADALIIADMGLLETDLPPIPLIASTQAHNASVEKVKFLEKVGFSRVTLARELSLEEVQVIRAGTSIDLECFVHGSLGVAYSGQCYLGWALGGKIGNRCGSAKPCRKPFLLKDLSGKILARDKYLLSIKDLNLSRHLGALIDAGVVSFKIEGRLKDRDYLRNVTSFYRGALDEVLAPRRRKRSSGGKSFIAFKPDPAKTSNRGYTDFFLAGRDPGMASPEVPEFLGEPVGRVLELKEKGFRLDGPAAFNSGDTIAFLDGAGEVRRTKVSLREEGFIQPEDAGGLKAGAAVYRNIDRAFIERLRKSPPERKIGVSFKLSEMNGAVELVVTDEDGLSSAAAEPAGSAVLPDASLKEALSLKGDKFFYSTGDTGVSGPCRVPPALLADMKRRALAGLEAARADGYVREESAIIRNFFPYPEKELDYAANVLNSKAAEFYRRHGVVKIEPAVETGLEMKGRRLMTLRYCLRPGLGLCPKTPGASGGAGAAAAEPLYLQDGEGNLFRLEFDCSACQMALYKE